MSADFAETAQVFGGVQPTDENPMDSFARRLAALFTVGLIAFYSPILGAFNRSGSWLGVPLLPLYIFSAWMGLIGVAWILVRRERR